MSCSANLDYHIDYKWKMQFKSIRNAISNRLSDVNLGLELFLFEAQYWRVDLLNSSRLSPVERISASLFLRIVLVPTEELIDYELRLKTY